MEEIYYTMNPWWEEKEFDTGIERDIYLNKFPIMFKRKQIEVIIGSRRIGKTTLIKQFIKASINKGVSSKNIFYIALDHPALSGTSISEHLKNLRSMFMHERKEKIFLFLDEVQESPNWEIELKSIYDTENLKIFCTGSTSSLIKTQGGRLTGRQIITTLYPLSFNEFILFQRVKPSLAEDYKYEKLVEEYLNTGGYPENVLNPSYEYMGSLINDILARDLIRLYTIKKPFVLKDMLRLIASSVGSRTSFNKISKVLDLSVDTVKEYLYYLESAFLITLMEKWTTSYTEKVYTQKKVYLYDTGIKTILTGTADTGFKAENSVYIELKRKGISIGYFAESEREVDFVIGNISNPYPVEVKYLSSFEWGDKRFSGLKLFKHRFPVTKKCLIISKNIETEIKDNRMEVTVIPLWKFLLSSEKYFD